MTNIDIDGIRNDIEGHLAELPEDVVDCVGCHIAVTDVPALLDLLAERDVEIKRLRAVAEAAQRVVEAGRLGWGDVDDPERVQGEAHGALIEALGKANTQEPCDICSSTGAGCPDCNSEATR